MKVEELTLITIAYNSSLAIKEHIQSLDLDSDLIGKLNWIVVDNASSDKTVEMVRSNFPYVTLVENDKNIGFGSAANVGIECSETRYVCILNPDVQLSIDVLEKMLAIFDTSESVALVGPSYESTSQSGNSGVDWVVGAMMMFDTHRMESVGFFDEGFFLYYEETDLCYRIKAKGLQIVQSHDAIVSHGHGESSIQTNESAYFMAWHYGHSYARIADKYPGKFLSVKQYLKVQKKRMLIARITFNRRRYILARAKYDGALAKEQQPICLLSEV